MNQVLGRKERQLSTVIMVVNLPKYDVINLSLSITRRFYHSVVGSDTDFKSDESYPRQV